ncbi:hypothetical protein [Saccharopolyspora phatthalungensis]|uniref:Uncharacterized protein YbjT (DUF2867 family) n=1 Tax=Saccharopolyspora phatthalungensis TaxID=664693 RepID=A0A840Q2Z5_9PSEU|nr:hypothetical protein [Saccharopolyspora phatthalungensis]MBB5156892.1 uncharacterized protein YbjT (DUF2867 family) [Saccharopolyspora phatthalungensis]
MATVFRLIKSKLFLIVGVLDNYGGVAEKEMHGRVAPCVDLVVLTAWRTVAGLPPSDIAACKAAAEEAADSAGLPWIAVLLVLVNGV